MRLALRPAYRANQAIFERATTITAISEQYLNWGLLHAGRDRMKTDRVFPHVYGAPSVSPADKRIADELWEERGVRGDSFVCCFIGTVNPHSDFEPVIACARQMRDAQFVICGDGDDLARLRKLTADLENVFLPGWLGLTEIISLMKLSDVGLAPYSAKAKQSLPNKAFEYFFGGLPVVTTLQGELENLLEKHQCGVVYDPSNPNDLLSKLRSLAADRVGVAEMGKRARRLYEDRFSADLIYSDLIRYLEGIAGTRGESSERV